MQIVEEFIPGAIGWVTAEHGRHYAEAWNFGTYFEAKVAAEFGAFALRCQPSDLVLFAVDEAGLAASLVLDLNDPASGTRGAHLRWFIVNDRCRGKGVGRTMMQRAVAHADAHSAGRAWLTTFAGLDAARHLYEAFGFRLAEEATGMVWGTEVLEQEFRR